MRASQTFVLLSAVGVIEALLHALQENGFNTLLSEVEYSPLASFGGVPYWVLGIIWFPVIFVVGLWSTKMGRNPLQVKLILLLSVGNFVTGYFWYLDLLVVNSFSPAYAGLYLTNYALTGLVVAQNWAHTEMRDFTTGTVIGLVVGAFFGGFGAAALGLAGGALGAAEGYRSSRR